MRDLASAIVDAYCCPRTWGRAFNLAGKESLSYRDAVHEVVGQMSRRVIVFPVPIPLAIIATLLARCLPGLPKIKLEQVLRLNEDKAFSYSDASEAWGFRPMDFTSGIRYELEELREKVST